mmetsp:Transcript_38210/g.114333  ORF Transcript_38210/g.114333 Transcript_38210/m.114333 type:complete len:95 (+) Transcript_38210:311-595(+)
MVPQDNVGSNSDVREDAKPLPRSRNAGCVPPATWADQAGGMVPSPFPSPPALRASSYSDSPPPTLLARISSQTALAAATVPPVLLRARSTPWRL